MTPTQLRFWRRFIDDGIGTWHGGKRGFETFGRKLNEQTNKFGINFPLNEAQFGKTVNFLDVTLYIDNDKKIQYKSYSKPTDAKRYLRPQSFHPKNVFESVPLSQMMRTIERNSTEETKKTEMDKMIEDFVHSGYNRQVLKKSRRKPQNSSTEKEPQRKTTTPIRSPSSTFKKSTNSRRSFTMPKMTYVKRSVTPN